MKKWLKFFLLLAFLPVISLAITIMASGPDLIGISNLTNGESRSGIFTINGVLLDDRLVDKVAVKIGNGPWEAAAGIDTWIYTVNSRQIALSFEYKYDEEVGALVKTYKRGPVYGDINISIGAFDAKDKKLAEKTVTAKIIPEAPYSDLSSGVYDSSVNIVLKAATDVSIYYTTNGADPKVSGTPYTGAIPVTYDTIIKAVAKSNNNQCSTVTTMDLKINNGVAQPSYNIQYYRDEALTQPLPNPSYLKTGAYYLKITTNKRLSGAPYISINAQGTLNDVNLASVVSLSDCVYRYTRVINADNSATGEVQETIQLNATDINGNHLQNAAPTNTVTNAAFLDNAPPTSGSISIEGGGYNTSDPTPYFVISSTGAEQMRLALSEKELGIAPWVNYTTRYDGFNISKGGNGSKTVWIEFKDKAGNIQSQHAHTTINYSNAVLSFDIEYYSDAGLIHSLGVNPCLRIGSYYLKITANQDLYTNPTVNIDAEGTQNDIFNGATTKITNRVFCYTRTLVKDTAAVGASKEQITVMGNTPSNADIHAALTVTAYLPLENIVAIASGANHSLALGNDGTVWAWGENGGGQLGNGTNIDSNTPIRVSNLANVISIAGGEGHSLALRNDGTVWSWGNNLDGELGNHNNTNSYIPVQVYNLTNIIAVTSGRCFSLALKSDGSVWSWGNNFDGQLGNNTIISSNTPVQVSNLTNVIAISNGYAHSLALKSDGTVWTWGENGGGQLGNNSIVESHIPVQVNNLTNVIAIAGGYAHSLALKSDGTVWAWGYNGFGELGHPGSNSYIPVQVSNLTNIIAIASGTYYSLALKSDGMVWAWGYNYYGQLGNGTYTNSDIPIQVNNLPSALAVSGKEYHNLVLQNNGTIWAWGNNYDGQLGNGTNTNSNIPVLVCAPSLSPAQTPTNTPTPTPTSTPTPTLNNSLIGEWLFDGNANDTTGNGNNGTVIGASLTGDRFGNTDKAYNFDGTNYICVPYSTTLNLGTEISFEGWIYPYPNTKYGAFIAKGPDQSEDYELVLFPGPGEAHFVINTSDNGRVFWVPCSIQANAWQHIAMTYKSGEWRVYLNGQMWERSDITGNLNSSYYPLLFGFESSVDGNDRWFNGKMDDISIYNRALSESEVQSHYHEGGWGQDTATPTPSPMITPTPTPTIEQYILTITNDGYGSTEPSGTLAVYNGVSTAITATPNEGYHFVNWEKTAGTGTVVFSDANLASTDVTVTGGNATIRANFSISPLLNISAIAGGGNLSLALKNDGTVWAWGWNNYGELGNGTNTYSNIPVPVSNLKNVIAITAGSNYSIALKNDGTVWAWGYNFYGELGNGTYTNSNTPVQVSNLTNVIAIAAGFYRSVALKNDGTVWAWGNNESGLLGNGTNTNSNTPVQVSNLTNVIAIACGSYHNLALKNDGTVWAWGDNTWYELGNGTNTDSKTPVQVSNLNNVIAIAGGHYGSLALKNDGTVWAWGLNYFGQLGVGADISSSSTPIQASSLSNVIAIDGGINHSSAIKNDGTIWTWGTNYHGQLGNGTNTDSDIPIQISNLTDVVAIADGDLHRLALKNDGTVWAWGNNGCGQLGDGTNTNSNVPVSVGGSGLIPVITPYQYALTITNDGNGFSTPLGTIVVNGGASTDITATPYINYHFAGWEKIAGTGTVEFGDSNLSSTTVTVTGGNATIRANFAINQYILTINNDGHGGTTPSESVTVNHGANTSISAASNTGYHFLNWTVTEGAAAIVDPNAASTEVALTNGNAVIQANFELDDVLVPAINAALNQYTVAMKTENTTQVRSFCADPIQYLGTDYALDGFVSSVIQPYFDAATISTYECINRNITIIDATHATVILMEHVVDSLNGDNDYHRKYTLIKTGEFWRALKIENIYLTEDKIPPILESLSITPMCLNTTDGPQTVTITVRVTDDLSGVSNVVAFFKNPSGTKTLSCYPTISSGDKNDGIYTGTLTFPQYSDQGTWKVDYIILLDNLGNSKCYYTNDLQNAGFINSIEIVSSIQDIIPPILESLSITPMCLNTTDGPQTVTITVRVTDDLSGVSNVVAFFKNPSETKTLSCYPTISSGDKNDGIYTGTLTFPQYSDQGTWKVDYIILLDNLGNSKCYYTNDLQNAGFINSIEIVSSIQDIIPPILESLSITPTSLNTTDGPQTVTVTVRVTDDLSGVSNIVAFFKNPSETKTLSCYPTISSGDKNDGIYTGTLTFPQYSDQGTWKVDYINLMDNLDNSKCYYTNDLQNAGFVYSIENGTNIPTRYTLTVNNDEYGSTTPSGSSLVDHGVGTSINATPNSGYRFVNWTVTNGTASITDLNAASTTVTLTSGNATIQANFAVNTYTVSYNGNGNTGGNVPDPINYDKGATVTVADIGGLVKTGYTFNGWNTQANGAGTGYEAGASFIMVEVNVTLYAQWIVNQYTVTYDGNGNTGGSVPDSANYDYGATVTVSSAGTLVKTGYPFSGWNTASNGSGTSYEAGASFTMGAAALTLYAQWTIMQYTITTSAGPNGSISPSGSVSVDSGKDKTFTIIPDSGYLVDTVIVDSVGQGAIDSYTFYSVTGNHNISATFKVIPYLPLSSTAITLNSFNGRNVYSIVAVGPVSKPEANAAPATTYPYTLTTTTGGASSYSPINYREKAVIQLSSNSVYSSGQTGWDEKMRQKENELLAKRIRQVSKGSKEILGAAPANPVNNTTWDNVCIAYNGATINTTCRYVSNHAYFFVDNRDDMSAYLADYGTAFDAIYEKDISKFGVVNDVDSNGKVIIVFSSELSGGLLGYFYSGDKYAKAFCADSNEGDIFYVTTTAAYQGDTIKGTLAHELQHMIYFDEHYNRGNGNTFTWLNEALSQAAEYYNGYVSNHNAWMKSFLDGEWNNGLSLTHWTSRNYGYGALFVRYLIDQYGDTTIKNICSTDKVGIQAIEAATGDDFNIIFNNFTRALVMTGTGDYSEPRYCFTTLDPKTLQPNWRGGLLTNIRYNAGITVNGDIYPYRLSFIAWNGNIGAMTLSGSDTGGTAFGLNESVSVAATPFGTWIDGFITPGGCMLYGFPATVGVQYSVNWDDGYEGSGYYSGDMKVSAYQKDLVTTYFTEVDSGYVSSQIITAQQDYVYILVQGYFSSDSGSFAIRVNGSN